MAWLIFSGEDGIDAIFDREKNKNKRHRSNSALVPFKTKDKYGCEDFSGVVGAFSRLMSNTSIKGGVDMKLLYSEMRMKLEDCSDDDFDKLFRVVEDLYFSDGKLFPANVKSLSYIDSDITQQQIAEYLYSLFITGTDLKKKYLLMEGDEDTNILEHLVFSSLDDTGRKDIGSIRAAYCCLPYIKEVFGKDLTILMKNNDKYKTYINRFLAYYYMFYVSQLAVKLSKFEHGCRNEIEKIYLSLNWEVLTKVRWGYEYGWKLVKEAISHMFSHAVVLEMLSHNEDGQQMDYIGLFERMSKAEEDEEVAEDINEICEKYKDWIPLDYKKCKHDFSKDGDCKTLNAVRKLFETVDYQFINGGRRSHYNGYNKTFIEFAQKNFGKWRGTLGYSMGVNESDIVMFTQIILGEFQGKIRLSKMFDEFEKRGLLFDRESKKRITELYEKMNLLEKRSDSGDAQYVKSVL